MDRALHHQSVQRALALGRGADPAFLPELIALLSFPGMLKKRQLYQQEDKRLISIHPPDKPRLDTSLHRKLALFGYTIPPG
jgi:hypothetical protein